MTLRQRFLGAFVLIIVLAVSLSAAVAYRSTQQQLATFVAEIGRLEANDLARHLGRAYVAADGWGTVNMALTEEGYFYMNEGEHEEEEEGGEENGREGFHIEKIRVVVVDMDNTVVVDNSGLLATGTAVTDLAGEQTAVIDNRTNQTVGYAYVDVNQEFLSTESGGFLQDLLQNSALGGLLIAVIALGLAFWLLRRIIAPVTALTAATQTLAEQGNPTLLPVTSDDELGQMSATFNQMTNALQTQRDLRQRLLNDVAHELNTPLSVIRLEAHGLRKGFQAPSDAANQIIQEINLLQNLVSDLNWLAETDSGKQKIVPESCGLAQLLDEEAKRWQPYAQAKQITLELGDLPELPTVQLDPLRIRQALGNVVRNGLQHTEVGGRVEITAVSRSQTIQITVTDNGAGIDPADLPHLFERFYRADRSRKRGTGGIGLGLAISHAILVAHSGTIHIASNGIGKGSAVTLELPAPQSNKK
ncbi:MAG: ATP-binding protein [Chloroflexota bacterium]